MVGPEYLVLGVILAVVAAWMLYVYFDKSGRSRPFWTKFLPGL